MKLLYILIGAVSLVACQSQQDVTAAQMDLNNELVNEIQVQNDFNNATIGILVDHQTRIEALENKEEANHVKHSR